MEYYLPAHRNIKVCYVVTYLLPTHKIGMSRDRLLIFHTQGPHMIDMVSVKELLLWGQFELSGTTLADSEFFGGGVGIWSNLTNLFLFHFLFLFGFWSLSPRRTQVEHRGIHTDHWRNYRYFWPFWGGGPQVNSGCSM